MRGIVLSAFIWLFLAFFYLWCVECWRIGCGVCWAVYPLMALANFDILSRLNGWEG